MLISSVDATRDLFRNIGSFAANTVFPRVRLGVTGLSRSGKTVFTTALVHHLINVTPMPVFRASVEGRIRRAVLDDQPDDTVPRFPFEQHLSILEDPLRQWPQSTTHIAELRVAIDYERPAGWRSGASSLAVDIIDYPGEWLVDLALLDKDYLTWSRETLAASRMNNHAPLAASWHAALAEHDPQKPISDFEINRLSDLFKTYLASLRKGPEHVATTPPGRFLMPGDLAGSPALTFSPLDLSSHAAPLPKSLYAQMERRYESYRAHVVRPFFKDHFSRLDRQIVLVDVLSALDSGPFALAELQETLEQILLAFRAGRNTVLSSIFAPRIDRVMFAATKADHLHRSDHARLEAILRLLVDRALRRTHGAGARVETMALASVRATREASVRSGRDILPAIVGIPEAGEYVGNEIFDGNTEAAVFPGELPEDPHAVFNGAIKPGTLRFPRFRPPLRAPNAAGKYPSLPHIRLDRALEFLIGDKLA